MPTGVWNITIASSIRFKPLATTKSATGGHPIIRDLLLPGYQKLQPRLYDILEMKDSTCRACHQDIAATAEHLYKLIDKRTNRGA